MHLSQRLEIENTAALKILIAGIGNVLRGDDGFGPAVVLALEKEGGLPEGVRCVELGIGGVGLVHELMDGYDALIVIDATDRGGAPGALYLLEPTVPDSGEIPDSERHALATDMHQAIPSQSLIVARAAGVLPPLVRMVGCQPDETDDLSMELSPKLREAVPAAVRVIWDLLEFWKGVPAPNSMNVKSHE
jgi:hydrogenase maturation protease